jgi:hypothetical protein
LPAEIADGPTPPRSRDSDYSKTTGVFPSRGICAEELIHQDRLPLLAMEFREERGTVAWDERGLRRSPLIVSLIA